MGRIRREALAALYEARKVLATGQHQFADTAALIARLDLMIDIGLKILEEFQEHGADITPTIGGVKSPIGVNVSIPNEKESVS